MVNRGRSGGCLTCKQRRVKCDEAKPECRSCQSLRLSCGGYDRKPVRLRFRDQNHKFAGAHGRHPPEATVPFPRPLAEPDTAVPFFLWHYASIGRDMQSARGFFEMLVPVYSSQRQTSALSLAVSAVASEILSLWRHRTDSFRSPRKSYARAVSCLRRAIQDRTERSKPATVFAVLTLQLYENMAAVYGLRAATRIHQNGAASLLAFTDMNHVDGIIHEYVQRFMLHTEIAAAMRQKRPLRTIAYSWVGNKDLTVAPDNPSSVLDAIGMCVAEIQTKYVGLSIQDNSAPSSHRALRELMEEVKRVDEQLLAWARSVPCHWNPPRLESGQDIDLSIPTYQSVCEVYPSCPVANLWNLWRFQRFVLVKITLASLNTILSYSHFALAEDRILGEIDELFNCEGTIQELVDSVCYSIPFYLGNRTKRSGIADFTDPEILLPSCTPLPSDDESGLENQSTGFKTQRDEHRRHIIAQGPWHAMNPLSRLLTLLSEDHGQLITSFLRPGQPEWIREQFLRVTTLLHLPSVKPSDYTEVGGTWNWSAERPADTDDDYYLRKGVRQGAIFVGSP
ncbi:hypothetical protein GGR53DRAFT_517845 [Hypoxylon sp. FL1150]|nr:hypothetical protein GGR53DRAFT_517845 [Hypoxylon sp. FL1150]